METLSALRSWVCSWLKELGQEEACEGPSCRKMLLLTTANIAMSETESTAAGSLNVSRET